MILYRDKRKRFFPFRCVWCECTVLRAPPSVILPRSRSCPPIEKSTSLLYTAQNVVFPVPLPSFRAVPAVRLCYISALCHIGGVISTFYHVTRATSGQVVSPLPHDIFSSLAFLPNAPPVQIRAFYFPEESDEPPRIHVFIGIQPHQQSFERPQNKRLPSTLASF